MYIVCKRKECARLNQEYLNSLNGELIKLKATHHHATQKTYKPWIEPKEGAVATTSFLNELKLKLGAKVMLIHNIDTVDCLTNGQLGELIDVIKTKNGEVDKLVIKLQNETAGKQNRTHHAGLVRKYPNCVIIERVSNQYTLRKKSGEVGTTATVMQFPVKLAFAITSHKIQGQTIPWPISVVLDLNSIFEDAQAHVMLSRVQRLQQVYILKSLDKAKIRTSHIGLNELERLKKISINKNPTPWQKQAENCIKVASLNCAGLAAHYVDILADDKLMKGDIIHLVETSLEKNEGNQFNIPGYKSHFVNVGNGKGIAVYFKSKRFNHEKDFIAANMQLTKLTSNEVDVINVYRSSNGNSVELLNNMVAMMTIGKPVLITGDFNICMMNHQNNRMSKGLEMQGFRQMIKDATHIRGGHIDHVYWKDENGMWKDPQLELHCPYYSDHDASLITLLKD